MSELDPQHVKRGFWINEAQGSIMGQTITTDNRTGAILIALLAVLSSLASTHLWHITAFLYHQARSKKGVADGLFRQQQALLRTLPSPAAVISDNIKLWWSWRNRARRAFLRLSPQLSLALLFAIGSLAASIFSSYVVSSDNIKVLINSRMCGSWAASTTSSAASSYTAAADSMLRILLDECYLRNSTGAECRRLIAPRIPTIQRDVPCPFNPSICEKDQTAVQLDTGLLHVNEFFGLNARPGSGVLYRKMTTCSVLSVEGRTSIIDYDNLPAQLKTELSPIEEKLFILKYGSAWAWGGNITFFWSLLKANMTGTYTTDTRFHLATPNILPGETFEPSPELEIPDADIIVKMVASGLIGYTSPVDDPLFGAHQAHDHYKSDGTKTTLYTPDFPTRAMGCALQYQFCIEKGNKKDLDCTNLTHVPGNVEEIGLAAANEVQNSILQLLSTSSLEFDISLLGTVRALSGHDVTLTQIQLPKDQWKQEVVGWESYALAGLQLSVSDHALGPQIRISGSETGQVMSGMWLANTTGEKALCNMQRMHVAGGFVNINVFGLVMIITVFGVVTVLDILLLRFLIFLTRFRKTLAPRIDQWIQDGVYQLQRQAYEANGEGTWSKMDQEIPVTEKDEQLSVLALVPLPSSVEEATAPRKPPVENVEVAAKVSSTMSSSDDTEIQPLRFDHNSLALLGNQAPQQDTSLVPPTALNAASRGQSHNATTTPEDEGEHSD